MPWMNGHTKPMAKAAMTGPINSHDQRRSGFLKNPDFFFFSKDLSSFLN